MASDPGWTRRNDVDGTGVDRALVNTQTASAETRTGRDPTMGLCAAVAAVQSTEAHHYPFHSPPGTVPEDPANRGSVVVVIWLPRSAASFPGKFKIQGSYWCGENSGS